MAHAHASDQASQIIGTSPPYFAEADWARLQEDDKRAGIAIVGLMAAIFTIGLFLYMGICFWVAGQVV
jgi:hypothetical protein